MNATPKIVRQKGDRRQLILDTTLRMIAAAGIDSVTHRKVAEAAEIPLGSTTYYFDSREHLIRETFDHYIGMAKALQESIGSKPIKRLGDVVNYLIELTNREFEDEALLLAEYEMTLFAARDSQVADLLHEWDSAMIANISKALKTLGAKRPLDAARTVLHLIRGYQLDRLTRHTPDPGNLRRRIRDVLEAFLN
ncbi:MAG: TetR family transcriptional regulator [Candidatus Poribacteria bacterium]|nr:TetR family transcriptional regulator [Candidatus Poribacteria bacterium]